MSQVGKAMEAVRSRVGAYLEDLPAGLASYPEYQHKAAIFRQFLSGLRAGELVEHLPPTLEALVRSPPPVNAWLPEVHAHAVYLAASAAFYPDEDAFVQSAYEDNQRLLQSPLYNILFKLVSPERVLAGAASRWSQFHRGQELVIDHVSAGSAAVRLLAPRGLTPPLLARCYGTAFRAAIEAAGGREVVVELTSSAAGGSRFEATWR